MEIQVRSEETGIRFHDTLKNAFADAKADHSVWKISFSVGSERMRLVKRNCNWVYEGDLLDSDSPDDVCFTYGDPGSR